jgi:hypothetical protein
MDWDELRTRILQAVHKQGDLLRHRVRLGPKFPKLNESSSRKPKFFFNATEACQRAELLRNTLPSQSDEIVRQADEICSHRFRLLGYENLVYGDEIDWHLDLVNGSRAPLQPWFKVQFLEFPVVGDHKVTWELNRHQLLVTLAKAWQLTRDPKYAHEIISQWRSWDKANPYPLGINWGSSLEVAFRSLSWIWVDHLIADAPEIADFRQDVVKKLAFNGQYIERYLSTYFSPNTHLLGEALALFFIGVLYPQISLSERWKNAGWKILLREAQRQVRSDGVYFEQSLHYHVYALDFFLHARILAQNNDVPVPAEFDATLQRMLCVLEALTQAGPPEGFGDDDGGRLFDPRRNRTGHMSDPLTLGAVLYSKRFQASDLTEESIWMFGKRAVDLSSRQNNRRPLQSTAFPEGGLYVIADSAPSQQWTIDAGPQGIGRGGHGHADALSLRFTMNGRRWIIDSGTGVYISSNPADRNALRGTAAHSTMMVDGLDQAVPADPFSWAGLPSTRTQRWIAGKTFSYFAGSHNGYKRLADPVTHGRYVCKVNGGPCLVRDVASGRGQHELEIRWILAPDLSVDENATGSFLISQPDCPEAGQLLLMMAEQQGWQAELDKTVVSPAYGKLQPTRVIRMQAAVGLPAETASVFSVATDSAQDTYRLRSTRHPSVQSYEHARGEVEHRYYFALDRPWSNGFWSSDAEMMYCQVRKGALMHLIVVGATHVRWQARDVLRFSESSGAFFEWRAADQAPPPESFVLSPLFRELTTVGSLSDDSTYAEKR